MVFASFPDLFLCVMYGGTDAFHLPGLPLRAACLRARSPRRLETAIGGTTVHRTRSQSNISDHRPPQHAPRRRRQRLGRSSAVLLPSGKLHVSARGLGVSPRRRRRCRRREQRRRRRCWRQEGRRRVLRRGGGGVGHGAGQHADARRAGGRLRAGRREPERRRRGRWHERGAVRDGGAGGGVVHGGRERVSGRGVGVLAVSRWHLGSPPSG